ncbi:MFS transporter [Gluconacetobacter diazotrophicus]|uniref:Putative major facilitator superfamily n=1 Tax=Gluconacetobacter diazotrophicus (strain ATCC 49037 / DSM 5601 / CCUG 37298 / CIP 103539 / LMG 7603 / PAl5) TaxID=272568 RepID=A9HCE6_GLUDA|nr:MFS transporter [Gluconacetobacter diazotrophicus]CAP54936.1 putative major facilitator superfamily [Gluconacetobacter diazotrophicus PA1 5]
MSSPSSANCNRQPPLTGPLILLLATACGLSVANVYYAAPMLDEIAHNLGVAPALIGSIITATQVGYGLGLIGIVPLGDLISSGRLVLIQGLTAAAGLVAAALSPSWGSLLGSLFLVGLSSVIVQTLVACAAGWAAPTERGQVVGQVTSGIVIGILCARIIAGLLTDAIGWRAVYLASAVLTAGMALALARILPPGRRNEVPRSYPVLVFSTLSLYRTNPVLRRRSLLAFLIFAMFNVLWAPLVLPLSTAPFSLSHTEVGLFGLAGVAGALGAGRAGIWADQGNARRTTILSFVLALVAWGLMAALPFSLWFLIAGILLLDFTVQAIHVTSQSLIFASDAEARSRLVGAYMVFYSLGSACGAFASTLAYAHGGWTSVCLLGTGLGLAGLTLAYFHKSENR